MVLRLAFSGFLWGCGGVFSGGSRDVLLLPLPGEGSGSCTAGSLGGAATGWLLQKETKGWVTSVTLSFL